jgi:hypothetical protein
MYAFIDRHPDTLARTSRFLLWAMRGWAHAHVNKACAPMSLYRGFSGLGAATALSDFHITMILLNGDALERLTLAPMSCGRVREDEAVLLALWRGVGREDSALVGGTLERLVRQEAVRPVARAMAACGTQLVMAGFDLLETGTQKIEDRA